MNEIKAVGEGTAGLVLENIAFQASILALHDAIQAATGGAANHLPPQTGAPPLHINEELHSLVERVRRHKPRGR
jgi:hypothetical protein